MTYTHIVSFKYKADVDETTRAEAWQRFLELKPQCQSKAGKPYIVSVKGAKENISPEGKGHGYHHVFVAEFPSQDDVNYYLKEDPVHLKYMDFVKPLLEDAFIYDFISD